MTDRGRGVVTYQLIVELWFNLNLREIHLYLHFNQGWACLVLDYVPLKVSVSLHLELYVGTRQADFTN